jgi:hypothetical protein
MPKKNGMRRIHGLKMVIMMNGTPNIILSMKKWHLSMTNFGVLMIKKLERKSVLV